MNVNGRSKIGKKQEGEVEKKERSMKTITIISFLCYRNRRGICC